MATPKHKGTIESIPENIKKLFNWHRVFVNTTLKPIKALYNLLFSNIPYNAERFISKNYETKLIELLSSNKYNIVQLEGLYLSPYIDVIQANSMAKIVMRSHNIEHQIWERMVSEESNIIIRWYKKNLANRVKAMELNSLSKIDALVPISDSDAQLFKKHFSGSLKVSSSGILNEKFHESENIPSNFFHIGALDWEPNIAGMRWFLDNVWKAVKASNANIDFYLAGRNAPEAFENELKKHNISYMGEVPNAADFMDKHGIMIVPLFSGSGMRIKIIEAMARGKCIITTPIGAEGIPVKNNKELIIAETAREMIEKMFYCIKHPNKALDIGKQAYIFAKKHYNNEVITGELLQFYKQISS